MEKSESITIEGPLTLTFFDDSVMGLRNRFPSMAKIKLFDGSESYGVRLKAIDTSNLQSYVVKSQVYRVEQKIKNIHQQRKSVLEMTKSLTFSMLYRQFDSKIWGILLNSDLVIMWNRQFPKHPISPTMASGDKGLRSILEKNKDTIQVMKQSILKKIQQRIEANPKLLEDEKRKQLMLAIRFINSINQLVWVLLILYRSQPVAEKLVTQLQDLLIENMERMEAPDYLALMLVELIIILANVQGTSLDTVQLAGHDTVNYRVEMTKGTGRAGERLKMKVTLTNDDDQDMDSIKGMIEGGQGPFKGIENFFSQFKSDGSDLGIFYLDYLKEACKKMNISLESFVNVSPSTRQSLLNFTLTF